MQANVLIGKNVQDFRGHDLRRTAATKMAERVALLSPRAVSHCKSLIHNARNAMPRRRGLELEREKFVAGAIALFGTAVWARHTCR